MSRDLRPEISPVKEYQPDKWTSAHRFMVMLEVAGKRPGEIASITESSLSRVSTILSDPRAELDRVEIGARLADNLTDIQAKLSLYAHEALETVIEEMRDVTVKPETRIKAGFGILDRAGYTPVQKQIVATTEIPPEIANRMESVVEEIRNHRFSYKKVEPKALLEEPEADGTAA
jgi:hypothetical protein